MQVYGQREPPEYKVENVKVPVATYRGENDYLTSKEVGKRGRGGRPRIRGQFSHRGTIGGCEKQGGNSIG